MSASQALRRAMSRPRKPLDPYWLPAILNVGVSTALTGLYTSIATKSLLQWGTWVAGCALAYSTIGTYRALVNAGRTGRAIHAALFDMPHQQQPRERHITPALSISRSYNAISHGLFSSAVTIGAIALSDPATPSLTIGERAMGGTVIGTYIIFGGMFYALGRSYDDGSSSGPPKNGPKP